MKLEFIKDEKNVKNQVLQSHDGNSCYKDGINPERSAELYLVEELSNELEIFLKRRFATIGIREARVNERFKLIAICTIHSAEVGILLNFTNTKYVKFDSYEDCSKFVEKLRIFV